MPIALIVVAIVGAILIFGATSNEPEQPEHDIQFAASEERRGTAKTTTEIVNIPYASKIVEDPAMYEGKSEIRTYGVSGQKELTYEQVVADGEAGEKILVKQKLVKEPIAQVTAIGTKAKVVAQPQPPAPSNCDSNYTGCVPIASDVDCAGGSGNGPAYASGPIRVIGYDKYDLDRDGNGIACE